MALLLPLNLQRFHVAGELGADGDALGAGLLAGTAAHALVGALVAMLGVRACWGIYMCATYPINKLSPGDLNQRSFPGPSSYSVAPCSWFSPNFFKRNKRLSRYPLQAHSLRLMLAANRVSE